MAKHYIIQVPEPCKQEWHTMSPEQGGRFCSHCSKTVTDFSKLSDEQIIKLLESQTGNLCGRLNNSQINRVITNKQQLQGQTTVTKFFAALLLLLTSREAAAYNPPTRHQTFIQLPVLSNGNVQFPDYTDTSHVTDFSGKVLDSLMHEPIVYAQIKNIRTGKFALTDKAGNFSIPASTGDTIKIVALGYSHIQFVVNAEAKKNYLLTEDLKDLQMVGMLVSYRPTVKDKIKRFFRTGKVSRY